MQYEELEQAGKLAIEFQGEKLDVYSLAIMQINVQEIIDEVLHAYLHGMIKTHVSGERNRRRFLFSHHSEARVLRSEIEKIHSSSLIEEIGFKVLSVVADSDVRAVLQSFAGGVVYAILASGVRGIIGKNKRKPERFAYVPNVAEYMRPIIQVLSQNGGGKLTFKAKINGETEEIIEIKIKGNCE